MLDLTPILNKVFIMTDIDSWPLTYEAATAAGNLDSTQIDLVPEIECEVVSDFFKAYEARGADKGKVMLSYQLDADNRWQTLHGKLARPHPIFDAIGKRDPHWGTGLTRMHAVLDYRPLLPSDPNASPQGTEIFHVDGTLTPFIPHTYRSQEGASTEYLKTILCLGGQSSLSHRQINRYLMQLDPEELDSALFVPDELVVVRALGLAIHRKPRIFSEFPVSRRAFRIMLKPPLEVVSNARRSLASNL